MIEGPGVRPYQHLYSDATGPIMAPFVHDSGEGVFYEVRSRSLTLPITCLPTWTPTRERLWPPRLGADYIIERPALQRGGAGWTWEATRSTCAMADASGRRVWTVAR